MTTSLSGGHAARWRCSAAKIPEAPPPMMAVTSIMRVQQILIGFVQINTLLDDGLVVGVQRDAGGVENSRALHAARLDQERVVASGAALIEPFADGIAQKLRIVRPEGRKTYFVKARDG